MRDREFKYFNIAAVESMGAAICEQGCRVNPSERILAQRKRHLRITINDNRPRYGDYDICDSANHDVDRSPCDH